MFKADINVVGLLKTLWNLQKRVFQVPIDKSYVFYEMKIIIRDLMSTPKFVEA